MVPLALGAVAAGAAVGVGLVAANRSLARLALPFAPDELHWARTADGWELPLGRYRPRGARAAREPVILCHGMGANRFNLDLNERYSVARYLAAKGFETWVVELRGAGITRRAAAGSRYRHCFDDEVAHDVPAILATVKGLAGAERIFWVGHSKGGMVMYGWCGLEPRADIAGVVAIGSPLTVRPRLPPPVLDAFRHVERLPLDAVYVAPALRALAPLGGRGLLRMRYMAASGNMEPEVTGLAMANLLGNVSRDTLRQFARWYRTGRFTTFDGSRDYGEGLCRSRVPFLLLAGAGDLLVPPECVERARDAMVAARAAGDVEYVLCARAAGFAWDYGHGDLVLGRAAPDEIFPRIEAWLRSRASAARTS